MRRFTPPLLALAIALALPAVAAPGTNRLTDWPKPQSAFKRDAALEARIAAIVKGMSLAQKIGQMTQPEIKTASPADVKQYYLGSVLNGGGSWPNNNKHATAADWLALANAYYDASMATDMAVKVPVIWGIDAVHGNNNVHGATIFPHNIGLGAAHNPKLAQDIGAATGRAVRATGIAWVFGPTLAVVRDDRWGRTYESFSEDPLLVKSYAGPYVTGLQGRFKSDANVVASIKHFMGDGGTDQGKDRGVTKASAEDMMNIHAQGYYAGLAAGAQTVMVSFNSWNDVAAGQDHGKLHGSKHALTDILKGKLGFDGFVISDWNGIAEIPGCRNDSCPQAVNAGIDMFMVPDDWKAFIANTTKQVESGEIPMARIDDAVTRILRVKLRAGLFGKRPSNNAYAGKDAATQDRALARRAVRESLVLLKNEGPVLPLARGKKLLVVGKSADNLSNQTAGWSLTWQGTANTNADFPHADSILAGIKAAAGEANVRYSQDGRDVNVADYDAVIAVIGETPYAEGDGDIGPSGTLRHSGRHPEDLAVLEAVAGKGKPVITVFVAGRPLWVNDLLNLSDTFVAAWLPGSEGKGVSDLLVAGPKRYDFRGTLSFSWPKSVCQTDLNLGSANYAPLFKLGYGLRAGQRSQLGKLDSSYPPGGCGVSNSFPVFGQADRASFPLAIRSGSEVKPLGADLNATIALPGVSVQTSQINTQQDAKQITWTGPATVEARGGKAMVLPPAASQDGALRFDTIVTQAPAGKLTLAMACVANCGTPLDATALFKRLAGKGKQTVKVPLACFAAKGVDLARVEAPFVVGSSGAFTAAFANIEILGGAAKEPDAVRCEELQ
ncbi:glycoside hydrolase family 3 protein [Massilia sp. Dwa41.01b]|uniref:glycoside hydrolase family 3 protein n=1 Tax=unclassified Massilia TaxID=2609279 RepID=UPI0016002A8B|nr:MULTISPECIES: exo 1,3/1,4-beta-D-glucan glucohydrolase [unclassified Massilia]QNA88267.1 glycoside hydrolase family 3 protein [Massilia sp. Dwa41.01b]QNA99168.1 glycoside hydrolase family 3 protein [Massilia sp. Se16.2.3]